jgi:hypothetical protein
MIRPGLYAVSAPGRPNASIPGPKKARHGPAERTTRRSRQRPPCPIPEIADEALRWIEIPECSIYEKLVEL